MTHAMTAELSDLLSSVLARATTRGATAADGFLVEEREFSATVRLGEVETAVAEGPGGGPRHVGYRSGPLPLRCVYTDLDGTLLGRGGLGEEGGGGESEKEE